MVMKNNDVKIIVDELTVKGIITDNGASSDNMLVVGMTDSGKSALETCMVSEDSSEILETREGDGNTTLENARIIKTDNKILDKCILVRFRLKSGRNIDKERDFIIEVVTEVGYELYNENVYRTLSDEDFNNRAIELARKKTENKLMSERNIGLSYKLKLLDEQKREEFSEKIVSTVCELNFKEVINIIHEMNCEHGITGSKLKQYSKQKLADEFDNVGSNLYDNASTYLECCNEITNTLVQTLLSNIEYYESEGYLYVSINNEEIDTLKTDLLLNATEHKSFEFLFEDIEIYTCINQDVLEGISENPENTSNIRNRFGAVKVTSHDTMGLYHADDTLEEAVDKIMNNIASTRCTMVAFVISLESGAHYIKSLEVLKELKSKVRRSLPVVVVLTKADKRLTHKSTNAKSRRGTVERVDGDDLLKNDAIIDDIRNYIKQETDKIHDNNRKACLEIIDIVAYGFDGKYSDAERELIKNKYNVNKALQRIIINYNMSCKRKNLSINVCKDMYSRDVDFKIDTHQITDSLKECMLKVLPISFMKDITENLLEETKKAYHGNSARASVSRFELGNRYVAPIDEDWYKNCQSMNVVFPDRLCAAITNEKIASVVIDSIEIKNAQFMSDKDEERFKNILLRALKTSMFGRKFNVVCFYNRYFTPQIVKGFFSYSALVENCIAEFYKDVIVEANRGNFDVMIEDYIEALNTELELIKERYVRFM